MVPWCIGAFRTITGCGFAMGEGLSASQTTKMCALRIVIFVAIPKNRESFPWTRKLSTAKRSLAGNLPRTIGRFGNTTMAIEEGNNNLMGFFRIFCMPHVICSAQVIFQLSLVLVSFSGGFSGCDDGSFLPKHQFVSSQLVVCLHDVVGAVNYPVFGSRSSLQVCGICSVSIIHSQYHTNTPPTAMGVWQDVAIIKF